VRNPFQPGVYCHICGKEGHPSPHCFKRFDNNVNGPPQKQASTVMTGYGVDINWYMDTGATDHITSELKKLTTHEKYCNTLILLKLALLKFARNL
jgi:hypothetical protein